MDSNFEIKKSQFVFKEVNAGHYSLDNLHCGKLSLEINKVEPIYITLTFAIKKASPKVDEDDIIEFAEKIDEFGSLILTDKSIISKLYEFINATPRWREFPKRVRFISQEFDSTFTVRIKSNGVSFFSLIRTGPGDY